MKRILHLACAVAAILPLAGCNRKPVLAAAPPPPPTPTVSVPPPTHPTEPLPEQPVIAMTPIPLPTEPIRRIPPRRRPQQLPPQTSQTAAVTAPVTNLGELTTGGESNNDTLRRQTEDLLRTQNRRLSGLSATVLALHSQQIEQVRLFLRQATEAWNRQDIEAARTLGSKAKVLLDEILE